MNPSLALCLLLLLTHSIPDAKAEEPAEPEWGDFTGQLIYDGETPERIQLKVDKKGFPETFDESLVVDPKTRGIANTFIYLRTPKEDGRSLPVHPDHAEQLKKPVHMTIDERGFTPHSFLVHIDQELHIAQRGKVAFNMKMNVHKNLPFGVVIPPDFALPYKFHAAENLPITLGCNIHPWISGYLLVRDNPYMAVTDAEGRFTIKNLPTGEHEFQFWQEKTGYLKLPALKLREVAVAGNLAKGRPIVSIQPGENNLGEFKIDPELFRK